MLGAVEAATSKWARSTALSLAGRGSSAGTAEDDVARIGRSLDERDDLCVRRDGDGARDGEEEARFRQDTPFIVEKDDRVKVLGSDAAGPSP